MRAQTPLALQALFFGILLPLATLAQPVYPPLEDGGRNNLVKVAKEQESQFARRGVLFHDAELQEIVDRVGATVFPALEDDFINFRVYLVRNPSPVVFSLADGQIYVHTGLLARLDNEAQLAAVLAHEAHHVAVHDHIMANNAHRRNAGIAGAMAMGMNSGLGPDDGLGGTWESNIGNRVRTKFTDEMEIGADAGSIVLIQQAGHPPSSALRALARIREDPELSTASPMAEFTSRESLMERQGYLQVLVDGLPSESAGASPDYDSRPLVLRRVIEMTIDDYIRLDRPGTAIDLVDSMIAVQPDAFLYAAKGDAYAALGPRPRHEIGEKPRWYVSGKRAALTRDEIFAEYMETEEGPELLAQHLENAAYAYQDSLDLDENSARAYRGLGHLAFADEDYRQAGRNYIKYLKLAPDAMDRQLVLEKLQHVKAELTKQKEMSQ